MLTNPLLELEKVAPNQELASQYGPCNPFGLDLQHSQYGFFQRPRVQQNGARQKQLKLIFSAGTINSQTLSQLSPMSKAHLIHATCKVRRQQ